MNYHNLTYPDMLNGDGLRVVLWLSACSHHCYNCQNAQTWEPNSGVLFDVDVKRELFNELEKDYISGLTLTGGDPLHEKNLEEVLALIEEIRVSFPEKTIWLYTGYTWKEIMDHIKLNEECDKYGGVNCIDNQNMRVRKEILLNVDVLVDGKYMDGQRDVTLKWRGSKNQRVIDIKKTLEKGNIVEWCD